MASNTPIVDYMQNLVPDPSPNYERLLAISQIKTPAGKERLERYFNECGVTIEGFEKSVFDK